MSKRIGTKINPVFHAYDLIFVAVLGLLMITGSTVLFQAVSVGTVVGLLAVVFAPGYALSAALFPAEKSFSDSLNPLTASRVQTKGQITIIERLLLSVGLSVCLVPLLGLGIDLTAWPIRPSTYSAVIGTATVVLTIIAAVRRYRLPRRERFEPSIGSLVSQLTTQRGSETSSVRLVLVIGLVIAAGGIGFAVLGVSQGEQFTEFSLLTENSETGEFVAGEYPEEIPRGETETIHVSVTNQEGQSMQYHVVILLQQFGAEGEIVEENQIETFVLTAKNGETVIEPHTIKPQPRMSGEDLRVTYLLYPESLPDNPSVDSAYRSNHIWIDVPLSEGS